MLAEIAASVRACRLLTYEAAWKADRGEATRTDVAMVKLHSTQMVIGVADRVSHVYGGPSNGAGTAMDWMCHDALAARASEMSLDLHRGLIARDVMTGMRP